MPEPKLSAADFAAQIKAKYPEYQSVDDSTLVAKMLEKYPVYADRVEAPGASPVVKKKDNGQPVSDSAPRQSQSPSPSVKDASPLERYNQLSATINAEAASIQTEWKTADANQRKELQSRLTSLQSLQREAEKALGMLKLDPSYTPSVSPEMEAYVTKMSQVPAPKKQKPYVPGEQPSQRTKEESRQAKRESIQQIEAADQEIRDIDVKIGQIKTAPKGMSPMFLEDQKEPTMMSATEEQKQKQIADLRSRKNELQLAQSQVIGLWNPSAGTQMEAAVNNKDVRGSQEAFTGALEKVIEPMADEVRVMDEIQANNERVRIAAAEAGREAVLKDFNWMDEHLGVISYLPKVLATGSVGLVGEVQKILNLVVPSSWEASGFITAAEETKTALKQSMGFSDDELKQSFLELAMDGKWAKAGGLLGSDAYDMYLLMGTMASAQGYGNLLKMSALERQIALEAAYGQSFMRGATKAFQYNILENPALASYIYLLGAGNGYDQIKRDPNASELEKALYPTFAGA